VVNIPCRFGATFNVPAPLHLCREKTGTTIAEAVEDFLSFDEACYRGD